MYSLPNWPCNPPKWDETTLNILLSDQIEEKQLLSKVSVKDIMKKSDKFPVKFPVSSIKCKELKKNVSEEILERNINSTYPIIHEKSLELCAKFILFKRVHGSDIEKKLYKNMSVVELIDRLLSKRAILFVGKMDKYIVPGEVAMGNWHIIGTKDEKKPLILKNHISYDEIKLSALLSVSSFTYFINDGNRRNCAKIEENRNILEEEGVIIGVIGTRLRKENVMEYQECVVSLEHPIAPNSIQSLFWDFYEEPIVPYKEVEKLKSERYVNLPLKCFDNTMYAKRLALSFDTLLIDANHRANLKNTSAFIHMVGIGLGVWMISSHQLKIFLQTFHNRLLALGSSLTSVSDINFSYMGENFGNYKNGDIIPIGNHPNGGIKIFMNNREPHLKLTGEHEGKLLFVTYAWDGNAMPGNEFWSGSLDTSGDPAAACSTQVAELHNALINPKVCGSNLHVATANHGVKTLKEYIEHIKSCI